MKKLLLTLMLLFSLGFAAKAEEAVLTVSSGEFVGSSDITVTIAKANGTTPPRWDPTYVRAYAKNTITIQGVEGVIMSKVVFKTESSNGSFLSGASADNGNFTASTKTWTGSANSFTLTNGTVNSGHTRINTITVTYTIEGGQKQDSEIAWSEETASANLGDVELNLPTLSNPFNLPVEYESSNTNVAGIDANGVVTLGTAAGVTVIAAKFLGNDEYKAKTAEYTLTVIDPNFAGYKLLTDISELSDGANGLLVCGNYKVVMNTKTDQANYRQASSITINADHTITTIPGDAQIVVFHKVDGGYSLQVGDKYLSLLSNANNLKTVDNPATATITIETNNDAKISFKDYSGRWIQCNNNDHRFACYTGSQTNIQIYVEAKSASAEPSLVSETVKVSHYKGAGRIGVEYNIVVADCPADAELTTDVKVLVNGQPIAVTPYEKTDAPASAPALAAAEDKTFTGTLYYEAPELKDADNVEVQFAAAINGKELVSKTTAPDTTTGIDDVAVDSEAAAEYYNLQGLRVSRPEAGQLYIKRQGGKAVKVRF